MPDIVCPYCGKSAGEHPDHRCLDAWAAILAGWKNVYNLHGEWYGHDPSVTDGVSDIRIPYFHSDISAAMELEEFLPKKLRSQYAWELWKILSCDNENPAGDLAVEDGPGVMIVWEEVFRVIHAQPKHRTRAFIKALAEKGQG